MAEPSNSQSRVRAEFFTVAKTHEVGWSSTDPSPAPHEQVAQDYAFAYVNGCSVVNQGVSQLKKPYRNARLI